ncbi:MAG TPA: hypothetical protein VFA65_07885 [Bryobacteraceae bacterium]|nr:hypothetical protein [Bryobacteraceae bacterium]
MGRYIIRVFSDQQEENATLPGTVVKPVNIQLSFYTDSADEAEKKLYQDIRAGKLSKGRVYQICPSMGSFEPIRTCAVASDGSAQRVFLDPVDGLYGETRRIRLPRPAKSEEPKLQSEPEFPPPPAAA